MKLSTSEQNVEVSGGSSAGSFSIAMNGKAFRVLSDTLYQNKIGSVVREICCNAYDAHVAAGKPSVAFVVHMPDNFEPWFAVQDFGVGLSEEQIKNVFTVYFESTKDSSNDSIGAFGLGAKTPFSYTDQFTVTSNYNGVKSIYSAFIGPAGVPDMQLMYSAETQDENGVEIKMSVRSQDFRTFEKELQEQLKFFTVKPLVKNSPYFKFNEAPKFVFEDEHIAICDGSTYGSDISIVQGIVGYKLISSNINGKLSKAAEAVLQPLIQKGRVAQLKFKIGEIGVTASREGVEYNAETVANIDKKLIAIGKSFAAHLSKSMTSGMSMWEKSVWLQSNNPFGSARSAAALLPADTKFDTYGNVTFDIRDFIRNEKLSVGARGRHINKTRGTNLTNITPALNDSTRFIVRDKCTFSNMRVNKFLQDNPKVTQLYIFECPSSVGGFADANIADKLRSALGGCPYVLNLSSIELDKAERAVMVKRLSKTAEWYKFNDNGKDRQFTYIEDIDEECVYVLCEFGELHSSKDHNLVDKYTQLARFYDGDLPPLIGVKVSQMDTVKKNKNLIPFEEFIKQIKEEDYIDLKLQKKHLTVNSLLYNNMNLLSTVLTESKLFATEAPDSKFTRALLVRNKVTARASKIDTSKVNAAERFFGWTIAEPKLVKQFTESYKATLDKLPFIREYMRRSSFFSDIKMQDLVQYVKHVPH